MAVRKNLLDQQSRAEAAYDAYRLAIEGLCMSPDSNVSDLRKELSVFGIELLREVKDSPDEEYADALASGLSGRPGVLDADRVFEVSTPDYFFNVFEHAGVLAVSTVLFDRAAGKNVFIVPDRERIETDVRPLPDLSGISDVGYRSAVVLLTLDLSEGGHGVNSRARRGEFFELVDGMSPSQLNSLREDVRRSMLIRFPKSYNEELLNSWFDQKNLALGELDNIVESRLKDRGEDFSSKEFFEILENWARTPRGIEYADELPMYAMKYCAERCWDYTKCPESLSSPQAQKEFNKHYLYLCESNEWEIFDKAYEAGHRRTVTLREPACVENGFIGDRQTFQSYFRLPAGIDLEPETVRRIGVDGSFVKAVAFKDFKDCTNVYAITDGDGKAVEFYSLPEEVRGNILKGIVTMCEQKRKDKEIRRYRGPKI